jgi:polysaccharide export outer membrane protein
MYAKISPFKSFRKSFLSSQAIRTLALSIAITSSCVVARQIATRPTLTPDHGQSVPSDPGKATVGHLEVTPASVATSVPAANYILGSDDQVMLSVTDLPEAQATMRVDQQGDLNVPLAGRVHAAGLTVNQLEAEIEKKLTEFVWKPHAMITILDLRSQPVSFLGEIGSPGIHQLAGHKTLVEMISSAGGLRQDAGSTIRITREIKWGRIPLPNAKDDATGQYSVASVPTKNVGETSDPATNIILMPDDVIYVSKADLVYVIGSVKRPGGFVLGQDETISATKAMALAFGLDKGAAGGHARITRTEPGSSTHTEIPIDIKKLLAGKIQDVQLKSNDILFVPSSTAKTILTRTAETGIQVGTSLAIYHF